MTAPVPAPGSASAFQRDWWSDDRRYRSAEHPISRIYAEGKIAFLERHLALPAGASILDVGTGNGTMFVPLAGRYRVVGIDTSPDLLARHVDRAHVAMASVLALPFADRSFDLVICSCLLHHVEDRARAVREMARVARRAVFLVEPNRWNLLQTLFSALVPAERGGLDFHAGYLRRLLVDAGLEVPATAAWGMTFPNKLPLALGPIARFLERPLPMGNVCLALGTRTEPASPTERAPDARPPIA